MLTRNCSGVLPALLAASAVAFAALLPSTVRAEDGDAGTDWLAAAYEQKAAGDLEGAVRAFEAARHAGANEQRVSLEIGYVQVARRDIPAAREAFASATEGPDPALAAQARRELDQLPRRLWADLYGEGYGWHRAKGSPESTDLVLTLRLRGFVRLTFLPDLNVYLYAQGTRDVASRGVNASGIPEIYADNIALFGAGALLRVWDKRLGFFLQAGPSVSLIDTGNGWVDIDARGGTFLGVESAECRPGKGSGVTTGIFPCHEVYSEAIYVSRFNHNIISLSRGRTGMGYLMMRSALLQGFIEGRVAVDRNGDFYNNFVDAGLGLRLRLLTKLPFDLSIGTHVGRYFGRENVDPAPANLEYIDMRLQTVTYAEF